VVVVDIPDDATTRRYSEVVGIFAQFSLIAVVSNSRLQVAVVEPKGPIGEALPLSLNPVPYIVLRTVPGVAAEEEARALLQAPLPPRAKLPTTVDVWGKLTILPLRAACGATASEPVAREPVEAITSDPPRSYNRAGTALAIIVFAGLHALVQVVTSSESSLP
jgi:hypothetical protein